MFCSTCGTQLPDGAHPCANCAHSAAAAAFKPGDEPLPPGIKGWSWGAFFMNWIWAIGNRTWIGLLAMIPYVGFIVAIWLGFKGREMAWKNKQWKSVEHFNRVQRNWSICGLVLVVIPVVLMLFVAVPAYNSYVERSHQAQQRYAAEAQAAAAAAR